MTDLSAARLEKKIKQSCFLSNLFDLLSLKLNDVNRL